MSRGITTAAGRLISNSFIVSIQKTRTVNDTNTDARVVRADSLDGIARASPPEKPDGTKRDFPTWKPFGRMTFFYQGDKMRREIRKEEVPG